MLTLGSRLLHERPSVSALVFALLAESSTSDHNAKPGEMPPAWVTSSSPHHPCQQRPELPVDPSSHRLAFPTENPILCLFGLHRDAMSSTAFNNAIALPLTRVPSLAAQMLATTLSS
jgi:hypothetical protein